MGALTVVVDVIGGEVSRRDDGVVAVDGGRDKGQDGVRTGHEGTLQIVHHNRGNVYLAVGDGEADGAAVDLTVTRGSRQGVVDQLCALGKGEGAALRSRNAAAQAQRGSLVELCGGERAAEGGDVIAQKLEHGGAGFFEGHGVVGAEAAVQIAAEPALLDCHPDVGAVDRRAVDVREEGAGAALRGHAFAVGREGREQPGQLAAGEGRIELSRLFGGHAAQSHSGLNGGVGASRRRGHHQHGHRDADRQQKREESFFHGVTP